MDNKKLSIKERKAQAKQYRKTTSRSDLGFWKVETNRTLVEELIKSQEKTRQWGLLPLRHERMATSPFHFFRGSAIVQAHDLAITPRTDFIVQACGDAHISNFGMFASPERRIVFDINDFDETLPAPFEVDIKRLVASIEICGRYRGFEASRREACVRDAASLYQHAMHDFSDMGNMEVWYKHLDIENALENDPHLSEKVQAKYIRNAMEKALNKNSDRAIMKLTETVDGKLRIKSDPPVIVPIRDMLSEEKELYNFNYNIRKALDLYKESLPIDRHRLIDQYEPLELAHKVVGVGSVGQRAWILVMMGRENGDPLVLQIKQAERSVLENYYGKSAYSKCGRRVVEGQHAIQTAGDILLGYLRLPDLPEGVNDYYVRQLWDSKGSFDIERMSDDGLQGLSCACAWTLAHAHAKTGDRHAIAAYLGKNDTFTEAMVSYAKAYADQNEADYETFLKMI